MKKSWFCCFTNRVCFAQNKTGILGTVLDAKTALAYVVSIQNTNVMQLTAIDGKFNFVT
jgi:hypothetical protein